MTEFPHLYTAFHPDHYDLWLNVDRGQKTITGRTTITGEALRPTIALHQKALAISAITVNDHPVPYYVDDKVDMVRLDLDHIGHVTVVVDYAAPLTDTMMGIYPSYYQVDGVPKQVVGTQFETTFARQAFPCVDEPEAKATFSLALQFDEHPGEIALANMPEVRVENGVHYFDQTVRMSTYLVAFVFGDLQAKRATTKSGVAVGVFATKAHRPEELDFALDIATRSIEFFEDYYQTPYPLPHAWQVALPDFSAGAMENWGLLTYREAYLLVDPQNVTLPTKIRAATVIAHEVAHQWFGDLVTMKWWDDLWLNESFANMMEYVAIDALEPDWHVWEVFQTADVGAALQRDATDGVQSVHVAVEDPAEIDALFDSAIVYAKGARMLVMVRALIGDAALRAGLQAYFAEFQYHNATGADLWAALGQASGLDIGSIMAGWLEQPGYPVVTMQVVDGQLTLHQEQFFLGIGEDQNRLWQVPLAANFKAPQLFATRDLVLGDDQQLRAAAGVPLRLNVGNESHFIVQYAPELQQDLLATANLTPIDQLQQLQDQRLLAAGRRVSYATLVPLLRQLADSESDVVIAALYRAASDLKWFVTPDSQEEKTLRQFFDQLAANQVARLGWVAQPDEASEAALIRPYVLSAALYAENKTAIAAAHALYQAHEADLTQLPAPIRGLVLANEVRRFGTAALGRELLDLYRHSSDATFQADLRQALTSTQDPALIGELCNAFEDAATIKPQDLRGWFRGLLANPAGEQAAWDWLRQEWGWLEATVGGDMEFATYITVVASIFKTATRLQEFKAFFEPKRNTPGLKREITMDIRVLQSRVALIEAEAPAVNQALQ